MALLRGKWRQILIYRLSAVKYHTSEYVKYHTSEYVKYHTSELHFKLIVRARVVLIVFEKLSRACFIQITLQITLSQIKYGSDVIMSHV
jgi:hypothetical protein